MHVLYVSACVGAVCMCYTCPRVYVQCACVIRVRVCRCSVHVLYVSACVGEVCMCYTCPRV